MYDENGTETKTRSLPLIDAGGYEYVSPLGHRTSTPPRTSRQVTTSDGHPISLIGRRRGAIGGEFYTHRARFGGDYVASGSSRGSYPLRYIPSSRRPTSVLLKGRSKSPLIGWISDETAYGVPTAGSPGITELNSPTHQSSPLLLGVLGTEAIAAVSPVKSHSGVATALAELKRDGIPSLPFLNSWKEKVGIARGAGSEYLNVQFGWLPLIRDIMDVTRTVRNSEQYLRFLINNDGKPVRRRLESDLIDEIVDQGKLVRTPVLMDGRAPLSPYFHTSTVLPDATYTVRSRKARWFSGSFVYSLAGVRSNAEEAIRIAQKADNLYGVIPSPEVIWNLQPWSWLTDWFINVGPVLANLSDAMIYGLVLDYGYMMEQSIMTYSYSMPKTDLKSGPGTILTSYHSEVKQRVEASPFGFGVSWEGFDAYQLSILAALGLSRR